jgi:hypothetical protein
VREAFLDYDPLTGIEEYFGWDEDGNEYVIERINRDLTKQVIDQNKRIEGSGMGKEMRLAASIPPEVQLQWVDKYGIEFWNPDHKEGVKRLLNSNEWRYLRVNHFMI